VKETASISSQIVLQPAPSNASELYLDLLKRTLSRAIVAKGYERLSIMPGRRWLRLIARVIQSFLSLFDLELVQRIRTTAQDYLESGDSAKNRAEDAETMLGTRQLDQMQACIEDVLDRSVPGDLLEAGVWRGGMTILMQAVLKTRNATDRKVWVVDSFSGLPDPDTDIDSGWWRAGDMAVPLSQVKDNFRRYNALDENVVFLEGFFKDTLPDAPIEKLAVLRLDADLYESTKEALTHLYPKLSPGGYAIFDDYQNLTECRRAIDEYRREHSISDTISKIDSRSVYWIKSG
jgi:hypothetical protein